MNKGRGLVAGWFDRCMKHAVALSGKRAGLKLSADTKNVLDEIRGKCAFSKAMSDQCAVFHGDDMISELHSLTNVVRRHDNGQAFMVNQITQYLHQL